MPRYLIRIHEEGMQPVLPPAIPVDEISQSIEKMGWTALWARHPTSRPHYHFLIFNDIKPNNMRQWIRKFMDPAQKNKYSVKEAKPDQSDEELIIHYGSYTCFKKKHPVYDMRFYHITEEQIQKMKERSEYVSAPVTDVAEKAKRDVVQSILDQVSYSVHYTEYENAYRFRQAMVETRNPNVYSKMQHYYRVWKDLSLKRLSDEVIPHGMEEEMEYEYQVSKAKEILEAKKRIQEQFDNDVKKHILFGL